MSSLFCVSTALFSAASDICLILKKITGYTAMIEMLKNTNVINPDS